MLISISICCVASCHLPAWCLCKQTLQNFMYSMLKDSHAKAAKIALDVMVDLYRKGVWNDQKTVNVITTALFSKTTKVMVTALKFFLGKDEDEAESSDSESEVRSRPVVWLKASISLCSSYAIEAMGTSYCVCLVK